MVTIMASEDMFSQKLFDKFCKKNKLKFPQKLIQFLIQYNDGELDVNIVDNYDKCCVRYFYGTTSEIYSNMEDVFECFKERMPRKCIPIAEAEGGNQVCMSLDDKSYGQIFFWDHETMDTDYEEKCTLQLSDMILLADSFESLLQKIIQS